MPEFDINVTSNSGDSEETISTDGYILLFLDGANKVKVKGTIDNKALMPIISKIVASKLAKWQ